ncbi:MAG TPA: hypothetical protein VFX43_20235 [Chitinophagaceae bacterium]|nr:hypothetical protein [Chitinophagaceae bacterium]
MARDRSHFTIDWENSENRLYRHKHPFLIPSMLESGHFVNEGMLPIKELKGKAQLNLLLEREREHLFTAKMHCCFREKYSTTLMI